MAEQKAVCGGFLVGDGLKMEGKVLSADGGSGDNGILAIDIDDVTGNIDKITDAVNNNKCIFVTTASGNRYVYMGIQNNVQYTPYPKSYVFVNIMVGTCDIIAVDTSTGACTYLYYSTNFIDQN